MIKSFLFLSLKKEVMVFLKCLIRSIEFLKVCCLLGRRISMDRVVFGFYFNLGGDCVFSLWVGGLL